MTNKVAYVLLFLMMNWQLIAQIQHGGEPISSIENLSISHIPFVDFPELDTALLEEEDLLYYTEKGRSTRFGYEHQTNINVLDQGLNTTCNAGGTLTRLGLYCPDAKHINLIFDQFYLPTGSTLFLYNEDKSQVLGAFNSGNNKAHGRFSTGIVLGDKLILEYYEPDAVQAEASLHISTVVHAYRSLHTPTQRGYGDSGSCNIKVRCPEGDGWEDEISSVGKIVIGGFDLCTGSMVNNTAADCTPYFLTAEHCTGPASDWVIYYNWESPGCANEFVALDQSVSGASMIASELNNDFALYELSVDVPIDYNVFFAGWAAGNTAASRTTGIHHPSGDIKKISFNNNPVTSTFWSGPPDTHWRVDDWEEGTTEGGSSGSPLFNESKQVVGVLTGGGASCSSIFQSDSYGKLSYAWETNGSSSAQLKPWLDPINSDMLNLTGKYCAGLLDLDAGIMLEVSAAEFCDAQIIPQITLTNNGNQELTLVAASIQVDGEDIDNVVWQGNLGSLQMSPISIDAIQNSAGEHSIEVCLFNINGSAEDDDIESNCDTFTYFCDELIETSVTKVAHQLIVYPNPASDYLIFEGSASPAEISNIYLVDHSGRQIELFLDNGPQVLLPNRLSSGLYYLTIRFENGEVIHNKLNIIN